jgi:hypothetical protein
VGETARAGPLAAARAQPAIAIKPKMSLRLRIIVLDKQERFLPRFAAGRLIQPANVRSSQKCVNATTNAMREERTLAARLK